LCQWFAAGDFDQAATKLADFFKDRVDAEMIATGEGVFTITPGAYGIRSAG
jgi:hypothetical protein